MAIIVALYFIYNCPMSIISTLMYMLLLLYAHLSILCIVLTCTMCQSNAVNLKFGCTNHNSQVISGGSIGF